MQCAASVAGNIDPDRLARLPRVVSQGAVSRRCTDLAVTAPAYHPAVFSHRSPVCPLPVPVEPLPSPGLRPSVTAARSRRSFRLFFSFALRIKFFILSDSFSFSFSTSNDYYGFRIRQLIDIPCTVAHWSCALRVFRFPRIRNEVLFFSRSRICNPSSSFDLQT